MIKTNIAEIASLISLNLTYLMIHTLKQTWLCFIFLVVYIKYFTELI